MRRGLARFEFEKRRCFIDAPPQPQSEGDQQRAQREGDSPSPSLKTFGTQTESRCRHDCSAENTAACGANLRKRPVASALLLRTVLDGEQDCSRPLATNGRA